MAFENVNKSSKFKKVTELKTGESLVGYVIGFEQNAMYKDKTNLIMQDENGERLVLSPAGNLQYMIKDGKIKAGLLTRITRVEDKKVKGKTSTQVTVEQDSEQTIAVAAAPANTQAASKPSMADTVSSLKGLQ